MLTVTFAFVVATALLLLFAATRALGVIGVFVLLCIDPLVFGGLLAAGGVLYSLFSTPERGCLMGNRDFGDAGIACSLGHPDGTSAPSNVGFLTGRDRRVMQWRSYSPAGQLPDGAMLVSAPLINLQACLDYPAGASAALKPARRWMKPDRDGARPDLHLDGVAVGDAENRPDQDQHLLVSVVGARTWLRSRYDGGWQGARRWRNRRRYTARDPRRRD